MEIHEVLFVLCRIIVRGYITIVLATYMYSLYLDLRNVDGVALNPFVFQQGIRTNNYELLRSRPRGLKC